MIGNREFPFERVRTDSNSYPKTIRSIKRNPVDGLREVHTFRVTEFQHTVLRHLNHYSEQWLSALEVSRSLGKDPLKVESALSYLAENHALEETFIPGEGYHYFGK